MMSQISLNSVAFLTIIAAGIVSGADLGVAESIGFLGMALSSTWIVAASTDIHFDRWREEDPGIVAGLRSHVLAVMVILGFTGGMGVAGYTVASR